MFYMSEWVDD